MATRRQSIPSAGEDPVVLWRVRRLREVGFDRQLAETLAHDAAYDLHAILSLVDRGCPAELAARILAPLDDERRPF
jgi:hypothetical protein